MSPRRTGARSIRIAILTIGTRGDTTPYVTLAGALARRGHETTVAALEEYRQKIESQLVRFVSLSTDFDDFLDTDLGKLFASRSLADRIRLPFAAHRAVPTLARKLMDGCWDAIREADLVVYHPFLIFVPEIAARFGVPAIMAAPQPLAATAEFPLCILARRNLGSTLNRATYGLFGFERALIRKTLRRFLDDKEAPPPRPCQIKPSAMMAYSPSIGPVASDWGDDVAVTGVWEPRLKHKWRLSDEIEAFLEDGAPPVYIGFGSMPWNPKRNAEIIVEAVKSWGGRAIVGRGWGGFASGALPPEVLVVGNTPHARLFPRVAAVVHHGGAGTTATGLAAGRPTFVTPVLMDQFFWGERVRSLGAGPAPVPLARLDASTLAARLDDLTRSPDYAAAAERVALQMSAEHGVAKAVSLIERALGIEAATEQRLASSAHPAYRKARKKSARRRRIRRRLRENIEATKAK